MVDTIEVNGNEVAYELTGPADAPVVTLSNSLMSSHRMWDPQMPALAGYRVLRYDTRGHGASGAPAGSYTLEILADDAVGLLDALGIAKTHFVGLSLGGMIGQTIAIRHPRVLRTLSLCATSSGYPDHMKGMWKDRIEAAGAHGLAPSLGTTLDRWFSPAFVAARPDLVDPVKAMILATPVAGYIGCCHAISKLDTTDRLDRVAVPTIVIVGADDPGTPVSMSEIMHARIPGSELVVLPGVRHLCNIEAPEAFNAALTGFLAKH